MLTDVRFVQGARNREISTTLVVRDKRGQVRHSDSLSVVAEGALLKGVLPACESRIAQGVVNPRDPHRVQVSVDVAEDFDSDGELSCQRREGSLSRIIWYLNLTSHSDFVLLADEVQVESLMHGQLRQALVMGHESRQAGHSDYLRILACR